MKDAGAPAPVDTQVLGIIADRIGWLVTYFGGNIQPSVTDALYGVDPGEKTEEKSTAVRSFDTPEEFMAARYGGK